MKSILKLEGTHRVRTHAVLLLTVSLTLTFDFSTQNHVTCRISKGHSLYQVRTLWDHSFLSYGVNITVNPNSNPNLGRSQAITTSGLTAAILDFRYG